MTTAETPAFDAAANEPEESHRRAAVVSHIDPKSALRISAAVGVCLFVAWMIAAVLIYILLGATGVWDRVNSLSGDLLGSDGISLGMYFGLAALVGVVEVVVVSLFFPLSAMLYNAIAGYVGGLRVTLDAFATEAGIGEVEPEREPELQPDAAAPSDGVSGAVPGAVAGASSVGVSEAETAGWGTQDVVDDGGRDNDRT